MELIGLDNYDCARDARLLRRLNRKRSCNGGFVLENSTNNLKESSENKWKGDSMEHMDSDYQKFLYKITRVSELRPSLEKGDDDGDEDYMDPQYMMFLKKVREDGKSYVLEVDENNGVLVTLKYEAEDMLNDECDPRTWRKTRTIVKGRKIEIATRLRNVLSKDGLENSGSVGSLQKKERGNGVVEKHLKSQPVNPVSCAINGHSLQKFSSRDSNILDTWRMIDGKNHMLDDSHVLFQNNDECDPCTRRRARSIVKGKKIETAARLRKFLSNDLFGNSKSVESLREKETGNGVVEKRLKSRPVNSVTCGINGHSGHKFSSGDSHTLDNQCRNDGENHKMNDTYVFLHNNDECDSYTRRKTRSTVNGEKIEIATGLRNVSRKVGWGNSKCMESSQKKEMGNGIVEKHSKSRPANPVFCGINGHSGQEVSSGDNHISDTQCRNDGKNHMLDDSYALFLNNTKVEGHCLIFEIGTDVVIYEGENFPDPEIFMLDNAEFFNEGICNPSVTSIVIDDSMEGADWQCLGSPSSNVHSHFRETVMSILKKPYDQKEYEGLLKAVKARKPVEYHLELRGRDISYSADKMGKSYLDWHSDLEQKIHEVESDQCKVLNLLRGFFFWLQNMCHQEAFQPWRDTLCLSVMPRSQ